MGMFARGRSLAAALLVSGLLVVGSSATGSGGGAEAATARAKAPRCTIVGTAKADRLVGTPKRDVICGRGGNDVIIGAGGNDVLIGGRGADTIDGRGGRDRISGGAGDDLLDGGPAADDLDGGAGYNACTTDRADDASHCVYDRTPARASELSVSSALVDVTSASQQVRVRFRVTDDTGVGSARVMPADDTPWYPSSQATRVGGGVRDGWWEATLVLPRWGQAGSYVPQVQTTDRLNRPNRQEFADGTITVVDSDPDTDLPQVELLSPTPSTVVDVRSKSRPVTVTARITDAKSGVDARATQAWIWRPSGMGAQSMIMHKVSGTLADGVWTGTLSIPRGSSDGDWRVSVSTSDLASAGSGRGIRWYGTSDYATHMGITGLFPNDMGTFRVLGGVAEDATPPTLSGPAVSPSAVNTLHGPATVSVSVRAVDAGSGVTSVIALLTQADGGNVFDVSGTLALTAGSAQDGTWSGTMTLPQGVPPGTYPLRFITTDAQGNITSFQSLGGSYPLAVSFDTTVAVTVVDAG